MFILIKVLTRSDIRIAFGMNFHGFGVVASQGENLFTVFAGHFLFLRFTTNLIRAGSRLPRNVIVANRIPSQEWASTSFWNLSCNKKKWKIKNVISLHYRIRNCTFLFKTQAINTFGENLVLHTWMGFDGANPRYHFLDHIANSNYEPKKRIENWVIFPESQTCKTEISA